MRWVMQMWCYRRHMEKFNNLCEKLSKKRNTTRLGYSLWDHTFCVHSKWEMWKFWKIQKQKKNYVYIQTSMTAWASTFWWNTQNRWMSTINSQNETTTIWIVSKKTAEKCTEYSMVTTKVINYSWTAVSHNKEGQTDCRNSNICKVTYVIMENRENLCEK